MYDKMSNLISSSFFCLHIGFHEFFCLSCIKAARAKHFFKNFLTCINYQADVTRAKMLLQLVCAIFMPEMC